MTLLRSSAAAFLTAVAVALAFAQQPFGYNPEAERQFAGAVKLFKGGQYTEALPMFDTLTRMAPVHQRTTAAFIMAAKSLFELKNFRESAITLVRFLKAFPATTYADDARYTLGLDYLMLQWYDEAGLQFLRTAEITDDSRLQSKASELFEQIAEDHLSIQSLQFLIPKLARPDTRALAELKLAQKYVAAGRTDDAQAMLARIAADGTAGETGKRAAELRSQLLTSNTLRIGVMLPLMEKSAPGPVRSLAEEMLDGMSFAVSDFKKQNPRGNIVALDVRDTERDSMKAISEVRTMGASPDIIAVLGPLFSNLAFGCAPIANSSALPLITPTATADGIASRGPFIFQLNPDFDTRGKIMARYAVQDLGYTSLAILASDDAMGKAMAESFSREATALGASIMINVSYPAGAGDLHEQFTQIRSTALKLAGQKDLPENTDVPITSIQGLFVPVTDPEAIGVIASQVAYFNVRTQLLGAGEWYDPAQLETHRRYANGVIFAADNYADHDDPDYRRFESGFTNEMGKAPTRYSLIGFDAMRLLLDEIARGAATRSQLAAALSSVRSRRVLHGAVSFSPGRVNTAMGILQYKNGEIRKLKDLSLY